VNIMNTKKDLSGLDGCTVDGVSINNYLNDKGVRCCDTDVEEKDVMTTYGSDVKKPLYKGKSRSRCTNKEKPIINEAMVYTDAMRQRESMIRTKTETQHKGILSIQCRRISECISIIRNINNYEYESEVSSSQIAHKYCIKNSTEIKESKKIVSTSMSIIFSSLGPLKGDTNNNDGDPSAKLLRVRKGRSYYYNSFNFGDHSDLVLARVAIAMYDKKIKIKNPVTEMFPEIVIPEKIEEPTIKDSKPIVEDNMSTIQLLKKEVKAQGGKIKYLANSLVRYNEENVFLKETVSVLTEKVEGFETYIEETSELLVSLSDVVEKLVNGADIVYKGFDRENEEIRDIVLKDFKDTWPSSLSYTNLRIADMAIGRYQKAIENNKKLKFWLNNYKKIRDTTKEYESNNN